MCPKNPYTSDYCGNWCGMGAYYQGYPGSLRRANGEPPVHLDGTLVDYKENKNNEREKGTSSPSEGPQGVR
jgi:hypothetical protein